MRKYREVQVVLEDKVNALLATGWVIVTEPVHQSFEQEGSFCGWQFVLGMPVEDGE
jgi:hypothetical protein